MAAAPEVSARERIMRATIGRLSRMDPAELTIAGVCHDAGVTAPTLYYYFGNKDGLVAAAVEQLATDWTALVDAALVQRDDLAATLDVSIDIWQAMIRNQERPIVVVAWAALFASGSEQSRVALQRARDRSQQLIVQLLEPHVADPEVLRELSIVALDGLIAASISDRLDQDEAALRERLIAISQLIRRVAASVS